MRMRLAGLIVCMSVTLAGIPMPMGFLVDDGTKLYDAGNHALRTGDYKRALDCFERALSFYRATNSPSGAFFSLSSIGTTLYSLGLYDRSLPYLNEALNVATDANRDDWKAAVYNNLGMLYYKALGRYDEALAYLSHALERADRKQSGVIIDNIGLVYSALGDYRKAIVHHQGALDHFIRERDDLNAGACLQNLAAAYSSLGRYQDALEYSNKALEAFKKSKDSKGTAASLTMIGLILDDLGYSGDALALLKEALAYDTKDGRIEEVSRDLDNIGDHYNLQKDYGNAERYFAEAEKWHSKTGYHWKGNVGLVEVLLAKGQFGRAVQCLQSMSPAWYASASSKIGHHTRCGLAWAGIGDYRAATVEFLEAVELSEELLRENRLGGMIGFPRNGARPYKSLCATLCERTLEAEKQGTFYRLWKECQSFIRSLLPWAGEPAREVYPAYGKDLPSAAFYFSESTKARTLIEGIAGAARRYQSSEVPEPLRKREQALLQELAKLDETKETAFAEGEEAFKEHQQRYAKAKNEMEQIVAQLRRDYPRYAALMHPKPLKIEDLRLKDSEVLLEYLLADGAGYVFVVEKARIRHIIKIAAGEDELKALVNEFMLRIENPGAKEDLSHAVGLRLHALLLETALKDVPPEKELIIVPDGILGLLPFEALVIKMGKIGSDTIYVGDRWTISYAQSATALSLNRILSQPQKQRPLFALGNPLFAGGDRRHGANKPGRLETASNLAGSTQYSYRALATKRDWGKTTIGERQTQELIYPPLPETEEEVRAIANLFGVQPRVPDILLGASANETTLRKSPLNDYRYLHFATHADLPGKVQGINEPFLLLGQVGNQGDDDGFLTLTKVLELNLSADLVVLSACLTGRGKVMEGEGVVNFARAFQHAGARSVVVSLWEVASVEAVEYMKTFYGLLREGKRKSEALNLTRREIRKKHPNPFYWAVFVLHGER